MIDSMLMLTILPSKRLHPHRAQDGLINLRLYAFLDEVLVFHVLIKQVQKQKGVPLMWSTFPPCRDH